VCGDGQMQPGEECDDGNTTNGDTCEANCTLPRCGNAILDRNERCDDGTETASCNANCTVSACGDGFLNRQAGETCDDGVNTGASSCDAKCQVLGCSASDEVPAMTDPASPSGLVSRSGAYDPFDEAWQAFDANNATTWISAPRETPAWISYEWQDGPRPITSYAITYVDHIDGSTSRAPQDWTFEGWDGMGWVVLDTRSAETDWVAFQRRVYTVTSPGNYGMYRLDITDDNDPDPGVLLISIGSLDLMGCPP
jgi:cysteine-rich repeat protein